MRIVLLWIAFITALSLAPLGLKDRLHTTGHLHEWGHFAAFLITAMIFTRVSFKPRVLGLLAAVVLGALLERLEVAKYHNVYEWMDVGMDALGALCGFFIMAWLPGFDDPPSSVPSPDA